LDNFDDRYLGAKTADPSVDNDGNALVLGALYFNSTDGVMKVYTSSGWIAASSASVATLATFEFVATSGQTVFTGNDANGSSLSYVAPAIIVTLNGVRLRPGDDYTATNGTSLTLVSAAALNDELVVDAFGSFLVANTYTIAQTDAGFVAVTGNQSISGNKNFVTNNTHAGGVTFDSTGTTQSWFRDTDAGSNLKNWGIQSSGGDFNILRANDDRASGFVTPLTIDSSGRVTLPYQPSFHAVRNAGNVSSTGIFICNAVTFNDGSHYNSSTGRFTAPVAGRYQLNFFVLAQNGNSFDLNIRVNGTMYAGMDIRNNTGTSGNFTLSCSAIFKLSANDIVDPFISSYVSGPVYGQGINAFSMHFLG
jgi:hypothetical protein